MLRLALLATPLLLVGCATPRTNALVAGDSGAVLVTPRAELVAPAPAAPLAPVASLAPVTTESAILAAPVATHELEAPLGTTLDPVSESLHTSRFTAKLGYYGSQEDALDDGYILNLSWMNFMSKIFALEFEAGYLDADGSDAGTDTDLWGIPLMVNGRLNVPIWIIDVYGGLGLGGFYYDVEASGAVNADDDGFLFGGNAFLGGTINLGDALALGLEGKYYVTDDISEFDEGIDAFALMLTLGFSR